MAWARSRSSSLRKMWPTWVLTVCSDTTRSSAISPFERPAAISARTSVSRSVNPSSRARVGARGPPRCANSAMRRRVMVGAMTALPAATMRTAAASSSAEASLSRKPLAPARSAA